MSKRRNRQYRWVAWGGLAGVALLVWTAPAQAQAQTGTGTGSTSFGTPGGFAGSSGGSTGGTGLGSSGMSGSSGSTLSFQTVNFNSTFLPGLSTTATLPGLITANTATSSVGGYGYSGGQSSGVTQYNPFSSFYTNPLALGYPASASAGGYGGASSANTFGRPIYTATTGIGGGTLGQNQITISPAQPGFGASSIGVRRVPTYTMTLGFDRRPPAVTRLATDVQAVLDRSSRLTATKDIKVVTQGSAIVLRGWVADSHDIRLAEILARMTPGVRDVKNELKVQELAPPPTPIR